MGEAAPVPAVPFDAVSLGDAEPLAHQIWNPALEFILRAWLKACLGAEVLVGAEEFLGRDVDVLVRFHAVGEEPNDRVLLGRQATHGDHLEYLYELAEHPGTSVDWRTCELFGPPELHHHVAQTSHDDVFVHDDVSLPRCVRHKHPLLVWVVQKLAGFFEVAGNVMEVQTRLLPGKSNGTLFQRDLLVDECAHHRVRPNDVVQLHRDRLSGVDTLVLSAGRSGQNHAEGPAGQPGPGVERFGRRAESSDPNPESRGGRTPGHQGAAERRVVGQETLERHCVLDS